MNPEDNTFFKPSPESERIFREVFEDLGKKSKALNKAKEGTPFNWTAFLIGVPIGILVAVLIIFYGTFSHGFVGYKLWQWFMVPTFNLPAITICQSIGIMFFVRLFTYENPFGATDSMTNPNLKMHEQALRILGLIMAPWVSLFFGYIVKSLI